MARSRTSSRVNSRANSGRSSPVARLSSPARSMFLENFFTSMNQTLSVQSELQDIPKENSKVINFEADLMSPIHKVAGLNRLISKITQLSASPNPNSIFIQIIIYYT